MTKYHVYALAKGAAIPESVEPLASFTWDEDAVAYATDVLSPRYDDTFEIYVVNGRINLKVEGRKP